MSDLTFNKIAGAVLATGLAIVGLKIASGYVFAPQTVEKPGYAVEIKEAAGPGAAAADVPPDWGTVLPTADAKAGEAVFEKCKSCHNADNGGPNQTGPNLWGVEGRKPGSHPGFAYSSGMTDFGAKQPVWDYDHLYEFIKGPQKYISGTKMTFVGLKAPQDRINVIAYLKGQGGNLPVPAPKPAAAAGAPPAGTGPAGALAPGAAAAGKPTSAAVPLAPGTGGAQGPGAAAVKTEDKSGSNGNTRK
jgi:cytochrome c